jgi:hypothetical protein
MDLWPDELSDIFRLSKTIYPTAIRNLGNSVVYQFVLDAMAESHPGVVIFLWNCFLTVRGPNAEPIPKSSRPRMSYSTQDIVLDFEVSPSLANTIILLLKSYFESAKAQDKAFGDVILDHITRLSDAQFSEKWFDLARAIGPSADVALRAYRICCSQTEDVRLCERALSYLSVGAAALDLRRVERALLCTMMDDRLTNIGYVGWINIVKLYCPPPVVAVPSRGQWQLKESAREVQEPKEKVSQEVKAQFQNDMTSILGFLWNRFRTGGDTERMKRSFVMETAALIDTPPAPIARWKEFRQWIMMWKNPDANWSNTVFDGELFNFNGGWKQEFIDALQRMVSPRPP